jgi:hypothetical protein
MTTVGRTPAEADQVDAASDQPDGRHLTPD